MEHAYYTPGQMSGMVRFDSGEVKSLERLIKLEDGLADRIRHLEGKVERLEGVDQRVCQRRQGPFDRRDKMSRKNRSEFSQDLGRRNNVERRTKQ